MNNNIFKKTLKNIFSLCGYEVRNKSGYDVINKGQTGNNILDDIKIILQPNSSSIIFDIGANIGQTTIEFSDKFPESTIYSFEPDINSFRKLTININERKKIKTYNIGFGNITEKVRMNINKDSVGNSILSISNNVNRVAKGDWSKTINQQEIEITTLNSFCLSNNIKHIDLIKSDL